MKAFQRYYRLIILNLILTFTFRLIEVISIFIHHNLSRLDILNELLGWLVDIVLTNIFLLPAFGVYYIFWQRNKVRADIFFLIIFIFLGSLHLIILKYFVYQLVPLDIFIFQYSLDEVLFTVETSGTSYALLIAGIILLIGGILGVYRWLSKKQFSLDNIKRFYIVYALLLFASAIIFSFGLLSLNGYSKNKPIYFYYRSVKYLLNSVGNNSYYDSKDSETYYSLFDIEDPVDPAYPLLHEVSAIDSLGRFFRVENATPPNIVIIIVEGLNDDFIHPYKGIELMPFLADLRAKSLYWDNCLALGERSFAVVPSILGGLPHGIKGFTLLNQLPYHLSLVSVLKSANYYTSFFYGQGAWFHKKDRFFKYNNMDLIFDKDLFSDEYDKIVVGKEHFFWGYNDKDLFQQSLKVIDTLPSKSRLDIYFTGSTHSPFAISDNDYYSQVMNNNMEKINDKDTRKFFSHYQKYIQSLVFLDDALKDFFNNYETRDDYENTIFIITGDHPMTELPRENSLKKYHVPLIIYSPLLNQAETFSGVVSQLDIYETILGFLSSGYNVKVPPVSASLGKKLTFSDVTENKTVVFMNDNRQLVDIYSNGYYLSNDKTLYQVENDLTLRRIFDRTILKRLKDQLEVFKKVNYYACMENKIIPDSLYFKYLGYEQIFSFDDLSGSVFNTEFYPITGKLLLRNNLYYCDFSLQYTGVGNEEVYIVYQLSDANDSIVFWNNYNLLSGNSFLQFRAEIPSPLIATDSVYFSSYFWNKSKQKIKYKYLTTRLFTVQ